MAIIALAVCGGLRVHDAAVAVDVPPDYTVLEPIDPIVPVDRALLDARVEPAWSDAALGTNKALAIDAFRSSAQPEVSRAGGRALMPASTTKLLTAAAVLAAFDPATRFRTTVTRSGGQVFLVGGGDPQLTASATSAAVGADASLARLASRTADALRETGTSTIRLRYDDTLFRGPQVQPFWKPDFLAIGVVAPISALSVDDGRLNPAASPRSPNPALTAAQTFAGLLQERGIRVQGEPAARAAAGEEIAAVESAPLADMVEHMLLTSDNTEAEVLGHQVGLQVLDDPSFVGGARATLRVLSELGVDTAGVVLNDNSGLARSNRISPQTLLAVLRAAIEEDPQNLWPVYTGLPVAGFDGSLAGRFGQPDARAGRGRVTGKTGTLTGTSTLAGLAVNRDQQLLLYAAMTNDVNQFAASVAIDELLAAVAGCRCASSG
ncbi:MAG: D-alanyl-D-alanine carboxypeptidase/D-alanyl-D-alanine-endopeptidase [Candidatus Nanopelagicales bacterium]|nr:D-alanyl-D-alanine carboxypeptidase/D-alanyl-D-alanine-endopeptidase [Candidatus Nanopelagicales bacterium]